MTETQPVLVLTTVGSVHNAGKIANVLIEKRLAACVNVIDQVRSFFRWEGSIGEDSEKLLLIKTMPERVDALREHLIGIHPYDTPEFIVIEVREVWEKYGAWIVESCGDTTAPKGG